MNREFIKALNEKMPRRAELVKLISEVIDVEKEPASRRLNGSVLFSAKEIGVLAGRLGISLDYIIDNDDDYIMMKSTMDNPMKVKSMDVLYEEMATNLSVNRKIVDDDPEFFSIVSELPFELFMPYPALSKFMFFKWGHYFIDNGEFNDFAAWKMPEKLFEFTKDAEYITNSVTDITYIWNDSLVWDLVREIEYLRTMHIISPEDSSMVLEELHEFLNSLQNDIKTPEPEINFSFYISNINIGVTALCLISENACSSIFRTNFVRTSISTDRRYCLYLKNWLNSVRNLSTLISGSGQRERRLFFESQHNIVNTILRE